MNDLEGFLAHYDEEQICGIVISSLNLPSQFSMPQFPERATLHESPVKRAECRALDRHLQQDASTAAKVSCETKIARTLPSSNYPFSYLSPASQKVRVRKLMQEQKMFSQQIAKYSCFSVTLDDEQVKQMSEIVATVEENPDLRTQLDEVLLKVDQHNEGHGHSCKICGKPIWLTENW